MKSLVIVQQYVPNYRVEFFEGLSQSLAEIGIELTVAAATPAGSLAERKDAAVADWVRPIPERRLHLFGRSLVLGGSFQAWQHADAVILPLQGSSADTYRAVLGAKRRSQKIGFWGHIKSYVSEPNVIDIAAERWLMKKSDHVFSYMPGGASFAFESGIAKSKVTTVMNSVDTESLQAAMASVSEEEVHDFRLKYGLLENRVLFFIGGLDKSKRIGLLADTLDILWETDPLIKILIGGRGVDEPLLKRSVDRNQSILLGHVNDHMKSLMARCASAIAIPGRIGLIAVESLVLQRPIISTDWAYHAPEREYLEEGQTLFSSAGNAYEYSKRILEVLDGYHSPAISTNDWDHPTLETMVKNFTFGISRMMEDS